MNKIQMSNQIQRPNAKNFSKMGSPIFNTANRFII